MSSADPDVPGEVPLGDLYREIIMDHARHPHGYGLREPGAAESRQVNPTCGDDLTVRLHADAAGERIESISWAGHGCAISQASASLLSDLVDGLDSAALSERIAAFREMMHSKGAIPGDQALLGDAVALSGASRYAVRVKCAMLAWVAVEDALQRV